MLLFIKTNVLYNVVFAVQGFSSKFQSLPSSAHLSDLLTLRLMVMKLV